MLPKICVSRLKRPLTLSVVSSKDNGYFTLSTGSFRSFQPWNNGSRPSRRRRIHTDRNGNYVSCGWHPQNKTPSKLQHDRCSSSLATRNNKGDENSFWEDVEDSHSDHSSEAPRGAISSHQPWKSLLEVPARAAWRATDPRRDPPDYLRTASQAILDEGHRTSKQLRRAHRKVLSIQSNLADMREKERRLLVNGKRYFKQQQQQQQQQQQNDPEDFDWTDDNNSINNRGRRQGYGSASSSSSSFSTHPVYYGYDETLATLKYRLESNFAITKRVLSECQSLLGGKITRDESGELSYSQRWQPRRILDFGIGCGSASAAAIDLFGSSNADTPSQSPIEWVHGIDPSQTMRECSQRLLEEMTRVKQQPAWEDQTEETNLSTSLSRIPPPAPRITFSNSLTPASLEGSSSTAEGSFDLALMVYTASDLPDISSCLAAAAMAFEKLQPNGVLVMIEPGTPDGFNSTRAVRNMLLDCCPPHDPDFEWEERCHILAPCTHNGSCPMERHKKNFFSKTKPIGKLGYDLPQELRDDSKNDIDNDENISDIEYEIEELDADYHFHDGLKPSETEAFNSSFCSFVHNVAGDSRKKGEKFSYLVAQKQRFRSPTADTNGEVIDPLTEGDPFRHDNVTDLLTDALDAASLEADDLAYRTFENARDLSSRYSGSEDDDLGLELLQGEAKRQSMGRIIRAPIKKKGHVYIDYCAAPGRIVRSRVTKALSNRAAPGIYAAARKSRWGGLWPDTMDRVVPSFYFNNDDKESK